MADQQVSPIRKLVQLIFDRAAGKKTEDQAKDSVRVVDAALNKLKVTAIAVGGALMAALALHKLKELAGTLIRHVTDFGKEAVKVAMESQVAWESLVGTLEAAGANVEDLTDEITSMGAAWQDATTHDDDAFFLSLQRMIVLTGDVSASMNNMGLVANVAAQFFRNELEPAVELVSKVMNGNTMLLSRMGIQVKSAQEGLEVLARRSFGAAERAAGTLAGKLSIITNLWENLRAEVGFVIIENDRVGAATTIVADALRGLTKWVVENKQVLRNWIYLALKFASSSLLFMADAVALTVGALAGMAQALHGPTRLNTEMMLFAGQLHDVVGELDLMVSRLDSADSGLKKLNRTLVSGNAVTRYITQHGGRPAEPPTPEVGSNAPTTATGLTRRERRLNAADAVAEGQAAQSMAWFEATKRAQDGRLAHTQMINNEILASEEQRAEAQMELEQRIRDSRNQTAQETIDAQAAQSMAWFDAHEALRAELANTANIANAVSDVIGAAMGGGIGQTANLKARQNLIEAAELAVQALTSSLNPFTAWRSPMLLAAAGKHLVIAGAWKGLAALAGGGGRGAGAGAVGGGGGIGSAGGARDTSARASAVAEPKQEVSIWLTGPGWDALNPEVQRVVYGAQQNARERYGQNVPVRVRRAPR